jgi:SdpC family antimicrobial peptide
MLFLYNRQKINNLKNQFNMKLIRKQARKIAMMLSLSLLFVSCSQYDGNETVNPSSTELAKAIDGSNKITGEELFKSILFVDGKLTKELPSLYSMANTDNLSKSKLIEYRKQEKEAIDYLEKIDANYFNKFQSEIYTKDPETISKSISKVVNDLIPFMNEKLAIQNLSIEKIAKTLKKDANGKIDIEKAQTQMKEMCAVWVLAVGVVLVAVAIFYVAAISEVVVGRMSNATITLEAISVQTAEAL